MLASPAARDILAGTQPWFAPFLILGAIASGEPLRIAKAYPVLSGVDDSLLSPRLPTNRSLRGAFPSSTTALRVVLVMRRRLPVGTGAENRMSKVNVNSADQDEIDEVEGLRGHGFEIVRYRQERGSFTSLRQLDEVPGLSGKVDEQTRLLLEV